MDKVTRAFHMLDAALQARETKNVGNGRPAYQASMSEHYPQTSLLHTFTSHVLTLVALSFAVQIIFKHGCGGSNGLGWGLRRMRG